ncbi:MAG TPA: DUF362 domain-containing protein [Anaerolineaceae bacterium]
MTSVVYYGSPRQARLEAKETLPAKLDLILEKLQVKERVKGELVMIKLHTGNNIGYSTIHPVFVRKVVQAVRDGGGKPFIADVDWDVKGAESRGYTPETLGCPIYPIAGPADKYYYTFDRPYKNIKQWKLAGMAHDATFLINFAHVKGHPSCGFGGAFKNIALGCMIGETRSAIHDTNHYDKYWFAEKCPDENVRKKIIEACPHGALVEDKNDPRELHIHFEPCNQCGRCLKVAPEGSLKIDPVNFHAFQEANAISVAIALSTFAPGKTTHLALATHMTPVCDCFGFTSMPILPDAGIFGSDDIVALDTAVLDVTAKLKLLEDQIPTSFEVHTREGHPFRWLHGPLKDPYKVVEYGEQLGLGSRTYEMVDVLPVEESKFSSSMYISAK